MDRQTKPAYMSKTLWGLLLILLPLVQFYGIELDIETIVEIGNGINELVLLATQLVGLILAVYGRISATKRIG